MSSSMDRYEALHVLEQMKSHLQDGHEPDSETRACVLAQISNLTQIVETPLDSVLRWLSQPMQNSALRIAVELDILSMLAETPSVAYSPDQLVGKGTARSNLTTKSNGSKDKSKAEEGTLLRSHIASVDPLLIVRIMRVLAAMGVCDEVGPQSYVANRVTQAVAGKGLSSGVKFRFDSEIPCAARLVDFLKATGFQNPEDSLHSPFEYAFGKPKFEWLADDIEMSTNFNRFMVGRREGQTQGSWMEFYPFALNILNDARAEEDAVFCVDVGGGKGHDLEALHERYPSIPGRLVLQDQEKVIGSNTMFESMVHNFFQPQPIKGARMYHLRAILHDWPTKECESILTHIAAAMQPDYSRLIIREFILSDTNAPLLGSCNDLLMMVLLAGMERTQSQWMKLLHGVGLDIVGFWSPIKGGEGVIEAVKKGQP